MVDNRATWAITIEGREDLGGILVLISDRGEAETIASEMCSHGQQVIVRRVLEPI